LAPHQIALIILWLATSITMIVMLISGVQGTNRHIVIRHSFHVIYVVVLLWYLARTGPPTNQLPALNSQVPPHWKLVSWLPVIGIASIFWLNLVSDNGRDLLLMLMMAATGIFLLVWRRDIRLRTVILSLSVTFLAYLMGLQLVNIGVISKSWNIIFTAFTLPMFVVGGLLSKRTKVGGVQLLRGQYRKSLKSLFFGCLLFVPLGLINAFGVSPIITTSVHDWWMPLWLPWWSGITEETWFRLYLVGLCAFLLYPALRRRPNLVVLAAILFSGIVFGVGHGRTLERFLTKGLLYGVPFAGVFAKRDWEHAVGAHYMVNLIPAAITYLLR
jgi:hypothetical protein